MELSIMPAWTHHSSWKTGKENLFLIWLATRNDTVLSFNLQLKTILLIPFDSYGIAKTFKKLL